jgi:phosphomannomutase
MGCSVIDLGQSSLPVLAFHVQSLDASAGLFVTGAGRDSSWTGFDLMIRGALPFPYEDLLSLEQSVKAGVSRQTRQIGRHQPLHGQSRYETSLEPYFHALRPLKIVCGSATRLLPRMLDRVFSRLPCELTHVPLPVRQRNLFDLRDVDMHRVATAVVEGQRHLGLVIDEDGRHVAFITDRGRLVSPREVARLLIEFAQREHHDAKFVVSASWLPEVRKWLNGRDAGAIDGGETAENLVRKLVEHEATVGLSADGRIWFGHPHPACDAVLVVANLLQVLSLSDAPFSEVISRFSRDSDSAS